MVHSAEIAFVITLHGLHIKWMKPSDFLTSSYQSVGRTSFLQRKLRRLAEKWWNLPHATIFVCGGQRCWGNRQSADCRCHRLPAVVASCEKPQIVTINHELHKPLSRLLAENCPKLGQHLWCYYDAQDVFQTELSACEVRMKPWGIGGKSSYIFRFLKMRQEVNAHEGLRRSG